jgi:hypothetical protein
MNMRRGWKSSIWGSLLVKPALVVGLVMLVDRLQHMVGIEPCFLNKLSASLSGLTGISDEHCFALLIVLALYSAYEVTRSILGLIVAPSRR